jgi:hypothetical protein
MLTNLKFEIGCDFSTEKDHVVFSYIVMKKEDVTFNVVYQNIERKHIYDRIYFKNRVEELCDKYNIDYDDVSNKLSAKEGNFYIHKTK